MNIFKTAKVQILANINGQMVEMAKNDPKRVPGLHGVCDDPDIPDEDENPNVKLKPTHQFYYSQNWNDCVDGVKKASLTGKRPWERGYNTPIETKKDYIQKCKIKAAREKALKLLEGKFLFEKHYYHILPDSYENLAFGSLQNDAFSD